MLGQKLLYIKLKLQSETNKQIIWLYRITHNKYFINWHSFCNGADISVGEERTA